MKVLLATLLVWIAATSGAQALEIYSPSYYTAKIPYNCQGSNQGLGLNGVTTIDLTTLELTNNSASALTVSVQMVDTFLGERVFPIENVVIPAGNTFLSLCGSFYHTYSYVFETGYYVIQSVSAVPGLNAPSAYAQILGSVEVDTYGVASDGQDYEHMGSPQSFNLTYVPGRMIR